MSCSGLDTILKAVIARIEDKLAPAGIPRASLDGSLDLFGAGVIDSLGFIDMILGLEEDLGIRFELDELNLERVDSLDALVRELYSLQPGATPMDA